MKVSQGDRVEILVALQEWSVQIGSTSDSGGRKHTRILDVLEGETNVEKHNYSFRLLLLVSMHVCVCVCVCVRACMGACVRACVRVCL